MPLSRPRHLAPELTRCPRCAWNPGFRCEHVTQMTKEQMLQKSQGSERRSGRDVAVGVGMAAATQHPRLEEPRGPRSRTLIRRHPAMAVVVCAEPTCMLSAFPSAHIRPGGGARTADKACVFWPPSCTPHITHVPSFPHRIPGHRFELLPPLVASPGVM